MKRNEQDIFDELVRGKLTGYTEHPEQAWIQHIHTKKNRMINLYRLSKLMMALMIAGLGIWGSTRLFPTLTQTANSMPDAQYTKSQYPVSNPEYYMNTPLEFASSNGTKYEFEFFTDAATSQSFENATKQNTNRENLNSKYSNKYNLIKANTPINGNKNTLTTNSQFPKITSQLNSINEKSTTLITDPAEEKNKKIKDQTIQDSLSKNEKACNADFDFYSSYTGEIVFNNKSAIAIGSTITWDFGDGNSSHQPTPTHMYNHTDFYTVTLSINNAQNGCKASISKNVQYQNLNEKTTPISVSGNIIAGTIYQKYAAIDVYRFNNEKGRFTLDQSIRTDVSGNYTAILERNKRYLLKAYPSATSKEYLSTYWGNSVESENASELLIMPSEQEHLLGYNIELVLGEKEILSEIPKPPPSSDNQVYLVDENNNIVGIGDVDENGNYTFGNNVKAGNYTIVNPNTGKTTSTSIAASGPISGNLDANASNGSSDNENVTVFPNPAASIVNFGVNSFTNENAILVIMNAAGTELVRKQISFIAGFNQMQYDISSYSPGIYYVMVFKGNQEVLSNKIVKLADATK